MSLTIKTSKTDNPTTIVIPFGKEEVDSKLIRQYSGFEYDISFSGAAKEQKSFYNPKQNTQVILIGLGEQKELCRSYAIIRSLIFHLRTKEETVIEVLGQHLSDEELLNVTMGLRLSLHNHGLYKTVESKFSAQKLNLVIGENQKPVTQEGINISESQLSIMELVDQPSNIKTPEFMGNHALDSGKKYGYDVKVIHSDDLKKMGMDALMAVGQGSINPPVLIVMEYKPSNNKSTSPKLGLVGKGISFDTGGISIKRSPNMGYMKSDMGGGAAIIGAIELAAKLKLDIHLVGVVPAAENSVDANSIRPGDVVGSYSGKTIEVIDTDAEGRMVLADGLEYIRKHYNPEYLIDVATLTGSCIQALGYTAAGLFTHNDKMAIELSRAGDIVNERLWRMPIWEDYMADMQSDIADIKNLSAKPVAGAITAAKFVEFFTGEHPNWAHLDIAGVAFSDTEYAKMRTSTAYGVRLLTSYMNRLIAGAEN